MSEPLGITSLTGEQVKNPKKSVIVDHILLEGHNTTYDEVSVLIPKNNRLKLHHKNSRLIRRDKLELNRNIYTYPLKRFV